MTDFPKNIQWHNLSYPKHIYQTLPKEEFRFKRNHDLLLNKKKGFDNTAFQRECQNYQGHNKDHDETKIEENSNKINTYNHIDQNIIELMSKRSHSIEFFVFYLILNCPKEWRKVFIENICWFPMTMSLVRGEICQDC